MAETAPQIYGNHRKFVPLYHFVSFAILAVNQTWAIVRLVRTPSWESGFGVLLAFALLCIFYYLREFPLKVQDRLIRLEMRLRLQQVLPADLRLRIQELTVVQLIALRFASDAGRPRPKKKRSRVAAVAAATRPAPSRSRPARSGAAARRNSLCSIALLAQSRLTTPETTSSAPHSQSSRFCSW